MQSRAGTPVKVTSCTNHSSGASRSHTTALLTAPARWLAGLSLARRFMLASLVILVTGMFGIGVWISHRIESGVIHRTSATTALYVDSFIQPHLQELAESDTISPESARELDWDLFNTALGEEIAAFKVWNRDGVVVYSMEPSLVGQQFPMTDDLRAAWTGQVSAEISALDAAENQIERQTESQLLEIYTPVRIRGGDEVIAVAEFYQQTDDLDGELASATRRSWLIVGGVTIAMYLLLAGFVQRASDTIVRQQRELTVQVNQLRDLLQQNEHLHERVSRAAARTTALNERFLRRFSAELHDGPAQDLSLALLKLDNVSVACGAIVGAEACAEELDTIQETVRRALQEVRSTSAGLLLPQLSSLSLSDAVRHAIRSHERRTGTHVTLTVGVVPETVPLPTKIALYRVIQEALTNACRHAAGNDQRVIVSTSDEIVTIEVSDAGPGFDAHQSLESDEHLGLVGMRERVESLGGTIVIESAPGSGTTVIAHLPLTTEFDGAGMEGFEHVSI
jgi:signal transduction histidine kinase